MADRDDRGYILIQPVSAGRNLMRILAAVGCKKTCITAGNSGQPVNAACGPLRALGITPGGAVTGSAALSGDQRRVIERARGFLRAAAAGPRTLAAHPGAGAVEDTAQFYATDGFGAAIVQLRDLLAIFDKLAPRSRPLARQKAR